MLEILKDLHEDDHFAIVVFDHIVNPWKGTLTKATEENVSEAMAFVREIKHGGCKLKNNDYFLQNVIFVFKWSSHNVIQPHY